jgi:peptide/nickel transport system permease protein
MGGGQPPPILTFLEALMNRFQYILRRLILSVIVLFGVVTITFVVARLIPSDPARMMVGPRARAEQVARMREEMGLDRPLHEQFIQYVGSLLRFDFGVSFSNRLEISTQLKQFLPATLELVFISVFLAVIIGIPLGVITSARPNSWLDQIIRVVTISGVSVPTFFLALILQIIFFQQLGWLPLAGRLSRDIVLYNPVEVQTGFYLIDTLITGNWPAFKSALTHVILPAMTLAVYPISLVARVTRASMLEVLSENFIRSARASGLPEWMILSQLALKNAVSPALTLVALSAAYSITGAFLVETVFVWPGIGQFAFDAIGAVDFPVILAITLVVTISYIVINLFVDVIQAMLDPRVTLE